MGMKYLFSSQKLGDKVVQIASVRAEDQIILPSSCRGVLWKKILSGEFSLPTLRISAAKPT
jgi:hypothetical protein